MEEMSSMMLRRPRKPDPVAQQQRIERAAKAEELMRNEAFVEAFDDVEEFYMNAWRNSDPFDVEQRERAYVATMLLSDLKNLLISRVRDGEVSRKLLESSLRH